MNSYVHDVKNNRTNLIYMFISIVPLILYGIYKNGILVYQKDLCSFVMIFKPLYLVILSFLAYELVEFIITKKLKLDYGLFYTILVSLFVMPNINLLCFFFCLFIGLIIYKFISKKININQACFLKLIVILGVLIFGKYSYKNSLESNYSFSFNIIDLIFGREIGGIASTSLFLGLIGYIILIIKTNYKKTIPIISFISYMILSFIIMFFLRELSFEILISCNVFLAFVFIATENKSTPIGKKELVLYNVALGLLTAILSFVINPYESAFISIIIVNILEKICKKANILAKIGLFMHKN